MSVRITASLFGVALALTVTAAPAAEDIFSGNHMIPACRAFVDQRSADDFVEQGICAGIVFGIVFAGNALRNVSPLQDNVRRGMCINRPSTATSSQVVRVVIAYIEARPARMHEPFNELALEGLRATWPCR
jgi:Rap1a immunity proteins